MLYPDYNIDITPNVVSLDRRINPAQYNMKNGDKFTVQIVNGQIEFVRALVTKSVDAASQD